MPGINAQPCLCECCLNLKIDGKSPPGLGVIMLTPVKGAGKARGAKKAGGRTIGILLSAYGDRPNRWIDEAIVAQTVWERLDIMMQRAHAFVPPGPPGPSRRLWGRSSRPPC